MLKTDALILLVNSLTQSEKKTFKQSGKNTAYMDLFNIIEKRKDISSVALEKAFMQKRKTGSFNATVVYLYKLLLNTLLSLRENQDSVYHLFHETLKVKILFEKSLFEEGFELLEKIKQEALIYENHIVLLYISKLELEYLLFLNFPNISETDLLKRHFRINEILKTIRKVNEQSSLYELLKHRIIYKGNIRSKKQKDSFNDLVVSEMSIVTSSHQENFEIKKLHQLFQSNYLMSVGDYRSALNASVELNNLFENNQHLWANPPSYYLSALEGILDNLRSFRKYDEMPYFIERLKKIQHFSVAFQSDVNCLVFLYELLPLLDKGDFQACKNLLGLHKESVVEKMEWLSLSRQAELCLYTSLIYIGLKNYKQAQKALLKIFIRGKNFYTLPLYRTIRLINLIIRYETGDFEAINIESRSIKREISRSEKIYRTEHLLLDFLHKPVSGMYSYQREKIWRKIQPELTELRQDIFEMQILKLFDFTAWIESKLLKIPLQEVLSGRFM